MKKVILGMAFMLPVVLFAQDNKIDSISICTDIGREVDDFTKEIKITTPFYVSNTMMLLKFIKKGRIVYYLSLDAVGSTYVPGEKGVIVLFTDGSKWSKQTEVDAGFKSPNYSYSSFIALTAEDLNRFCTKTVLKYRLYIFDKEIEKDEAVRFKEYVNCIKKAK